MMRPRSIASRSIRCLPTRANDGALNWADRGVGYVLSGPESNKDRLQQVARSVYDQTEKNGG